MSKTTLTEHKGRIECEDPRYQTMIRTKRRVGLGRSVLNLSLLYFDAG